jgi:predicted phosphodiesterase
VTKFDTWVFATDLHGDHQNSETVEALLKFTKSFKPKHRIFGGDLFDFRAMRRGASKAEQAESMELDVWAGMEFLSKYKPTIFLRGNHDERIWDMARFHDNGIVRDMANQGIKDIEKKCRSIGCKMLPYDATAGVHTLHKTRFIHGFHAGLYATKKHAEVYAPEGGLVLHGHTHAIQFATIARKGGASGMGVGCLARLDMEYNRHQTGRLMHGNGWGYGISWKDGQKAFQADRRSGQWCVANKLEIL